MGAIAVAGAPAAGRSYRELGTARRTELGASTPYKTTCRREHEARHSVAAQLRRPPLSSHMCFKPMWCAIAGRCQGSERGCRGISPHFARHGGNALVDGLAE